MHPGADAACVRARAQSLRGSLQRAFQPPDDDAAGPVVGRGLDLVVDIKHQFRHLVVPIQMRHRFRREPAAMRGVQQRGRRRRKLVDTSSTG